MVVARWLAGWAAGPYVTEWAAVLGRIKDRQEGRNMGSRVDRQRAKKEGGKKAVSNPKWAPLLGK